MYEKDMIDTKKWLGYEISMKLLEWGGMILLVGLRDMSFFRCMTATILTSEKYFVFFNIKFVQKKITLTLTFEMLKK